jgi:hypothetical protein
MEKVLGYLWKILKTKTFWVNFLGGVLQIVNATTVEIIPVEIATTIQFVINMLVRMITTEPVSKK